VSRELLLASTSVWRRDLLLRLGIPFRVAPSDVDETPQAGETPQALAARLACAKAAAVAKQFPEAVVIGSDQVASLEGQTIGKPHTRERAFAQLHQASGCRVDFFTALSVQCLAMQAAHAALDQTVVVFRRLDDASIERYLDREDVLQCAGAFRCEGLGISLFERIDSNDPSALIGLPLIATSRLLRACGYALP
jgi:septum formation protein